MAEKLTDTGLSDYLNYVVSVDATQVDYETMRHTLIALKSLTFKAGKRKINLNRENKNGLTLLMWTTTLPESWRGNGHVSYLQKTLAQFPEVVDINYKNKEGKSFKDMATPEDFADVAKEIDSSIKCLK